VWGPKVLALVLTGMGSDGLRGAQAIVAAGGNVVAQDEASSVVWGMPGQVANAGICSAVLPLNEIAPRLTRMFTGERP
jgi:two-component system chemotaxis response regulator CheB